LKIKAEFHYAKTYEAQGDIIEAISHLKEIDKTESNNNASDEEIYAKSLLNLGRLYFQQNNLRESFQYLQKLFNKTKNSTNKKLLDIASINYGMIKGSQSMNDYIKLINNSEYEEFLKLKLKYFKDDNKN
jgi:tetratricopeptide (TPR) repeat protein